MNHQKIYENIISKAKSENRLKHNGTYYEEHHIVPKCLIKNNESTNKVLLTAKEHYLCHKLLVFIYPNNKSIFNAFYLMSSAGKNKYNVSSRDYAYARELFVSIPVSQESKRKNSESHKGKPSKLKNIPKSKEHRIKIGIVSSNRSAESNYRCGSTNRGKKTWMSTHKHSDESKERNRQAHIGKCVGEENGMYRKTVYEVWVEKFGKEEADRKEKEKNKKISNSLKRKNINRKISEESKEKNRQSHIGKKHSKEQNEKQSQIMSKEKNPMFRKTIYDIWIKKYGIEEANIRHANWKKHLREAKNKNKIV